MTQFPHRGQLGTFGGVFTPSILTILGIILFLRLGYVVGQAGLSRALIIIAMANTISLLTSISLSAVATNLRVKGGGDYYLISRTLGVEYGGALGIVLFLAQAISVAFYCIGFGEAIVGLIPGTIPRAVQVVAALAASFLFVFAWLGADWATRLQYVVMTLLAVSLFSFFAGGLAKWDAATLAHNWATPAGGHGFWVLFAIFFPAVTGFTQGVSMSGDLEDPGKSLPVGTLTAVGMSILVYFAAAIVFAGTVPQEDLMHDYYAMKRVALVDFLVDLGVIAATLSSAMASFLGAPRILQSLAGDRVFPFLLPFAKGSGPSGNPRRGVILAAAIAYATIGLGNLNVIAPIVSMFFLISYGLLNYATFYEARSASPSFRPTFRLFDYRLSFLGFLACLGGMLAISLPAGVVAISILFAIHQYLKRTAGPARWADSRRSYHLRLAREHLVAAAKEPEHPRDWRPQVLAFSNQTERREQLLTFASWIRGGGGIITSVQVLEGEGAKMLKLQEEAEAELRKDITESRLPAFPLVIFAPNFYLAVQSLVQSYGVGPLRANTILFNWLEQLHPGILGLKQISYARNLRAAFRLGCNVVVLGAPEENWRALEAISGVDRRIDVWWRGDATSHLMLLLAYLMTRDEAWDGATIRLLATADEREPQTKVEELKKTLADVRIQAQPEVISGATAESLAECSAGATFVFLPFRLRRHQLVDTFGNPLEAIVARLGLVAMVMAAKDVDLDAEPEEGKAGESAAALDALNDTRKKAEAAEKAAAEASEKAEQKSRELEVASTSRVDEEQISRMEAEAKGAAAEAQKASRRAAKAQAKAEEAARRVQQLGIELPEEEDSTD